MPLDVLSICLVAVTLGVDPGAGLRAREADFAKVDFANDVVPILTKLTCNSGNCHGKSGGQNGFRLSLLGFDSQADFDSIVNDGRGRRVFASVPEMSLLIRKATGRQAHGGGKLLKPDDDSYRLLVDWIRQGTPPGDPKAPTVASVTVVPSEKVMKRAANQKLRVIAKYTDGRELDVTRRAQFLTNDESVAIVDEAGVVTTRQQSGEAAIMARFIGRVGVFHAIVPLETQNVTPTPFTPRNFIDRLTQHKWNELGLQPSPTVGDERFIRRVSLDLCGKLPTPQSVREFVESKAPNKRDALIDRMLDSPDYAAFQALRWGAVMHNRRGTRAEGVGPSHAMTLWLKDAFAADTAYSEIARSIVTARGSATMCPPVVWYRNVRTAEDNVDQVSQMFLGMRVQCARCHHHPYEKWSQDDYYGMASFFARVNRKVSTNPRTAIPEDAVVVSRKGLAKHQRTGETVKPRALDGPELDTANMSDPREALADWMTRSDNPFFAKAAVNRVWGQLFSRGIVEPVDDMRVTNPPTNPQLLDALAADFVANGFRMKSLLRTICQSATYQRTSEPIAANAADKQNFARYYARRLPAEVLLDAVDSATGVKSSFGFPSEMRVVDLPDERADSYFLDTFGRPQRASSCECERSNDASLSQALHLLNSKEVREKLTPASGAKSKADTDKRTTTQKIDDVYLTTLARLPTANERKAAEAFIVGSTDKAKGFQTLLWSLMNAKEFQFNF